MVNDLYRNITLDQAIAQLAQKPETENRKGATETKIKKIKNLRMRRFLFCHSIPLTQIHSVEELLPGKSLL
jgi:hypothetical protein